MSSEIFLSAEKSEELKEAGLPQPAPAMGQIWWHGSRNAYVIVYADITDTILIVWLHGNSSCEVRTLPLVGFVESSYAAPADYIMRQFSSCNLYKANKDAFNAFYVTEERAIVAARHYPIAAEALADLYLKKQKETQS